jgi:hypothetical protein
MITLTQRKKMLKAFKGVYAKEVLDRLNEKKIMNKKGNSFSIAYITHVFNGRNTNLGIEETIIALYTEKVEEAKRISRERKEVFSTKKPEAGTSGLI